VQSRGTGATPDDVTGNMEPYQNISDREAYRLAFVSLLEADSSFLLTQNYYFNLRCRLPLVSDRGPLCSRLVLMALGQGGRADDVRQTVIIHFS
jgi:hypothetical protein